MKKSVELNTEEYKVLWRQDPATEKKGGFQKLLVRLQKQTNTALQTVRLEDKDLEEIPRYAFDYGNGSWESRLIAIFGRTLGPKLGRESD